jgi:transposase
VAEAKCASDRLVHVWADAAYRGFVPFAGPLLGITVAIVSALIGAVGFHVQPRRWVVERTFGWLTRWRRLNRNYEHTAESAGAVVWVAMIGIMTRRLAKTNKR